MDVEPAESNLDMAVELEEPPQVDEQPVEEELEQSLPEPNNKYYFQIRLDEVQNNQPKICIGICRDNFLVNQDLFKQKDVWCINLDSGDKYNNLRWKNYYENENEDIVNPSQYGQFTEGSVIGVLLDMDRGNLNFFKDGNDLGLAFNDPQLKEGDFYPFIQV